MRLGQMHNLGMKIVVERHISRQMGFKQAFPGFISSLLVHQAMPGENPPCVGINHKGGLLPCIQKDGVRRLRADSPYPKKFLTKRSGLLPEKTSQTSLVTAGQKIQEILDPRSLHVEVPCGTNFSGKPWHRHFSKRGRRKTPGPFEIPDRFFYIGPGGILGQDRADDNFQPGLPGPPVLMAKGTAQHPVHFR